MTHLTITSPQFEDRNVIPSKYTCDGENINPPLAFDNIPHDTKSLALIVEDPDSVGKTWVHWILFNINPATSFIPERSVPSRTVQGVNDFGKIGYGGPCPVNGTHRYYFKLYALDVILDETEDITREELERAMENHIIEKAELVGLYVRE
jgi:Raf kinase inhibitor-like YbhB/YbcL family protein